MYTCIFSLIYITDWFATFLHAAGLKHKIPDDVDSFNVWRAVSRGRKSQRKSIIFNIDRYEYKFILYMIYYKYE